MTQDSFPLSRNHNLVSALIGLLSLLPLVLYQRLFQRLFWFGDEIHLLLEVKDQGFFPWLFTPFAENFCPLFKFLWGGAAIQFGGSYWVMLLVLWGTHAINVYLFSSFLFRIGFSVLGVLFAGLVFGLSWSNLETLGWTVQWSAVLSLTFFFFALHMALAKRSLVNVAVLALLALMSCLCFSRGVLAAGCIGLFAALLPRLSPWQRFWSFWTGVTPALFTAGLIFALSTGNHHGLEPQVVGKMFNHALHIFSLNPFFQSFSPYGLEPRNPFLWITAKLSIISLAIYSARRHRTLLLALSVLLAFDLGNSLLLGLGRYHEGAVNSVGLRYQYVSLFCFLPFLSLGASSFFHRWRAGLTKNVVATLTIAILTYFSFAPWQSHLKTWSKDRGKIGRRVLIRQNTPGQWYGIPPFITWEQAKEVVRHYRLH